MYPAVSLMYFVSAAVILLASLALIVKVSLPCNRIGRASVLYNFIFVFLIFFVWSKVTDLGKFRKCDFVYVRSTD